ncbi:hypothetical protein ACRAWG_32700 [Methylobacterium sp. P31]
MPAIVLAIAVVWGAAVGIVVVVAISMDPAAEVSSLAKAPGTLSEDGGHGGFDAGQEAVGPFARQGPPVIGG